MVSRRLLTAVTLLTTAVSFFLLGVFHARTDDAFELASYDAKLDAVRAEVRSELIRARHADTRARAPAARRRRPTTARPTPRGIASSRK